MRNIFHNSAASYGMLIAVTAILVGVVSFFLASHVSAADDNNSSQRLVTIHDLDQERVIYTTADTVQQALDDAHINLDPKDTVEPARDAKLVASSYTVNIYPARPVIVVDGAVREKIMTSAQTTNQIVADAGMTLHDEDKTTLTPTNDVATEGASLELDIQRATPFTLSLYGTKTQAYTQSKTVGDMLKTKNITLAPNDTLSVPTDTPITAGMEVDLWRNGVQTVTEQQPIPFSIRQIQDTDQPVGYNQIETPGINGLEDVVYQVTMQDGQEVGRTEIQTLVVTQPTEQVEDVGIKNNYSGSLQDWLLALRTCETHGNYTDDTGNGYYGAYQFSASSWDKLHTGYAYAYQAPPAVQDQAIIDNTNASRGGLASQNPGCYARMGLSQFPPS